MPAILKIILKEPLPKKSAEENVSKTNVIWF
jgi:hypothetical protein